MAQGAKKLCAKPGCFDLAVKRSRCEAHQPVKTHNWTEYDKARPSRHERGYNSKWVRASKNFLKRNPLCAECKRHGRTKPATLVDHIIPHRGNKTLFWDVSNWEGLCIPCHAVKTGKGL